MALAVAADGPDGATFTDITPPAALTANLPILPVLPTVNNPNRCRSYRVAAIVTDDLGHVVARLSWRSR